VHPQLTVRSADEKVQRHLVLPVADVEVEPREMHEPRNSADSTFLGVNILLMAGLPV